MGVAAPNVTKFHHAIIYTGNNEPRPIQAELPRHGTREIGMQLQPIRVQTFNRGEALDEMSRLDYGARWIFYHGVSNIKLFGRVMPDYHVALYTQYQHVWQTINAQQAPSVVAPSTYAQSNAGSTNTITPNTITPNTWPRANAPAVAAAPITYQAMVSQLTDYQNHARQRGLPIPRPLTQAEIQKLATNPAARAEYLRRVRQTWADATGNDDDAGEDDEEDDEVDDAPRDSAYPGFLRTPIRGSSQAPTHKEKSILYDTQSQPSQSTASVDDTQSQLPQSTASKISSSRDKVIKRDASPRPSQTADGPGSSGEDHESPANNKEIPSQHRPLDRAPQQTQHLSHLPDRRSSPPTKLPAESLPPTDSGDDYSQNRKNPRIQTSDPSEHHGEAISTLANSIKSTLAHDVKRNLKTRIAHDLVEGLNSGDTKSLQVFIEPNDQALPQLLRSFAMLKKMGATTEAERDAAKSVHMSRESIARNVTTRLITLHPKLFLARDPGMAVEEEMRLSKSYSAGKTEDLSEEVDDSSEDGFDAEDLSDAKEALDFLQKGPEYPWLVQQWRKILLANSSCRSLLGVQEAFFNVLSKTTTGIAHEAEPIRIDIDWDPISYMMGEFGSDIDLGQSVVVVGDTMEAYSTTCSHYLSYLWPVTGPVILEQLQNLASSSSTTADIAGGQMNLTRDPACLCVEALGTPFALLEILEIMSWIGTACRASQHSDAHSTCQPVVVPTAHNELEFKIRFMEHTFAEMDNQAQSTCWHALFRNITIASGYPIPQRLSKERGLEVSQDLMTLFAQSYRAARYEGCLMLKSFNSILVPSRRSEFSIQWHLLVHKDCSRISYNEGLPHADSETLSYEDIFFSKARHFIGWSEDVEIIAGKSDIFPINEIQCSCIG